MIVVFQFFRAALALATHPGDILGELRQVSDPTAQRRAEMNAIVQFALDDLRARSDVGSGRDPHPGLYKESHTIFINGNDVADLSSWMPGDIIHISNPVPYARKIEIGRMHTNLPGHEYEMTEQALQAKYGDIARIEFTYMPVKFSKSPAGSNPKWLQHQPAIMIQALS